MSGLEIYTWNHPFYKDESTDLELQLLALNENYSFFLWAAISTFLLQIEALIVY
jgi:hypothetical protein